MQHSDHNDNTNFFSWPLIRQLFQFYQTSNQVLKDLLKIINRNKPLNSDSDKVALVNTQILRLALEQKMLGKTLVIISYYIVQLILCNNKKEEDLRADSIITSKNSNIRMNDIVSDFAFRILHHPSRRLLD